MKKIVQIFCVLIVSVFVIGCQGNIDCNSSSTVVAELNEKIPETNFQQGLITKDTTIKVETEDKKLLSTVTIKKDTQFENKDGIAITEIPSISVKTTQLEETSNSTIKFTNRKGEVVAPNKPFKVAIKAPTNAKVGDRVKIGIPDGSSTQIQKVIIRVVDKNGFISVEITINDPQYARTVITIAVLGNGATN